jgi:CheY-like chemotaxis protein
VTDVVMPGVGGLRLATVLQAARPELKVLYFSGYTADTAALQELVETGSVLLSKPFTPQQLASKVREVLDG